MKKEITFDAAYDKRNPDPSKNYGIHGVNLKFILMGEKGAVQFLLYTNWMLPEVQEELNRKHSFDTLLDSPLPADLGYHSPIPMYENQSVISENCKYLGGKPCYYDGSGLNAERVWEILLREGSEGVWKELEDYYKDIFGELL